MRVLHLTPTYRPALGGIEAVVENLCAALAERGVTSDVAHVAPGLSWREDRLGRSRVWRVPLHGHAFAGLAPRIGELARGYDLLHAHDPQLLSLTASILATARRSPAVLSTHGGFRHTRKFGLFKRVHEAALLPPLLKHYRLVLATSRSDLEYFGRFSDNVALAENGVDVAKFSAITPSVERSPWNWLYWGRLSRNKRVDLVADLAQRARDQGRPVNLTICGQDFDGSGESLRRECDRLGRSWVRFESAEDDAGLAALIARAGLYVSASEHEGFGLTIIEAMSAGLPIICRDIAPLNGFVDASCGQTLAFDGGTTDAAVLDRFLSTLESAHPELSAGARRAAQRYDWVSAADRFLDMYRQVLDAPDARPAVMLRAG